MDRVRSTRVGGEGPHLRHCPRFVVPSDELDTVRIPQLETRQERDGLDREETSVDVISQEEVIRVRRVPSDSKDLYQVVELPVLRAARIVVWGEGEGKACETVSEGRTEREKD